MKHLKNFFKGMVIGIATLVPGVSGGTMAVILGVYDNLIHAISSFFENWKKHTILMLQLGLGGLLGVAIFSQLLESVINKFPHIIQFLFMGAIVGGLPVLYRKSKAIGKREIKDFIFLILGFVIVLLMSAEPTTITDIATSQGIFSMLFLFVAGVVIAIALVLPGISGSFMLLTLGLYNTTLNSINNMNIPFLIPLGLGVLAGVLGTTKIIEKFLQKYPGKTYMLIMGFVIGSLIAVFPGVPTNWELAASIAVFAIGFYTIFWLGSKDIRD